MTLDLKVTTVPAGMDAPDRAKIVPISTNVQQTLTIVRQTLLALTLKADSNVKPTLVMNVILRSQILPPVPPLATTAQTAKEMVANTKILTNARPTPTIVRLQRTETMSSALTPSVASSASKKSLPTTLVHLTAMAESTLMLQMVGSTEGAPI